MAGLVGKKIGMTRIFDENGKAIPLTVVECLPNKIVQIKTESNDGHNAIVVGYEELKKPLKTKSKIRNLSVRTLKPSNFKSSSAERFHLKMNRFKSVFGETK